MAKRPAFQFYPSDWRNDPGLRLCSIAARGLWADMLCLMHEGEPYGHLTVLSRPMEPQALAKLVGEGAPAVKRWLAELQANEVYSVTDAGVIFSRRMVRDEALREVRANGGQAGAEHGAKGASHGKKGGRPKGPEGGSDDPPRGDKKPPLEPPPSSSSSSSSPASTGSEDKSSALADPSATAWELAKALLTERGGATAKAAGSFFGGLLAKHRIEARDLLPALAQAQVSETRDPQSYLTRAAEGVAKRKADFAQPKLVGFV